MSVETNASVFPQGIDDRALWNSAAAAFVGNSDKGALKALEIRNLLPNTPKMTDRQIMDFPAGVCLGIDE